MRGAVAPGCLQLQNRLPGGVAWPTLVGQRGASDVAAEPASRRPSAFCRYASGPVAAPRPRHAGWCSRRPRRATSSASTAVVRLPTSWRPRPIDFGVDTFASVGRRWAVPIRGIRMLPLEGKRRGLSTVTCSTTGESQVSGAEQPSAPTNLTDRSWQPPTFGKPKSNARS